MIEYVVGFLFNGSMRKVLLIEKKRPDWQKGKLNGIGGHVEDGESPHSAMEREFREETGLKIYGWHRLCILSGNDWKVHFFYNWHHDIGKARTKTDEVVIEQTVELIITGNNPHTLPNLSWLIPMAISYTRGERAKNFEITEIYE